MQDRYVSFVLVFIYFIFKCCFLHEAHFTEQSPLTSVLQPYTQYPAESTEAIQMICFSKKYNVLSPADVRIGISASLKVRRCTKRANALRVINFHGYLVQSSAFMFLPSAFFCNFFCVHYFIFQQPFI